MYSALISIESGRTERIHHNILRKDWRNKWETSEKQRYKNSRSVVPVSKKAETWKKMMCWPPVSPGSNGECFCPVREADGMF